MEQERWQRMLLARVAEQAERYDDVVEEMKKVIRMDVELIPEERNLLSIGYKNVVGAKRESWRVLSSIEEKEDNEQNLKKIKVFKHKIEDEITNKCEEVMSVIDDHLLPSSSTPEFTAFFYKMKGDYYRYLAEIKVGDDRKDATDQSLKAYEAAKSIAELELPPMNQVRLGVALNFSVLYYEILNSPERAYNMAKYAYDDAIAELDGLNSELHEESILIMQVIRDNLILWVHYLP